MVKKTIGQVIEEGGLRRFADPRLIKALGHPVREHILVVLNERVASPAEIGREIGLGVEDFYHHVEVLEKLGWIEVVEIRRRRGVHEHFFRARRSAVPAAGGAANGNGAVRQWRRRERARRPRRSLARLGGR